MACRPKGDRFPCHSSIRALFLGAIGTMPYDDDDDLFGEEFDFVDDDDSVEDDSELEEKPKTKPTKKKPAAKDKEKADKPARAPKRAPRGASKAEKPAAKRESRRDDRGESEASPKPPGPIPKLPAPKATSDKAPVGYLSFAHGLDIDDEDDDQPPFAEKPAAVEKAPVVEARIEEPAPAPAPPEPTGPPADHVIHIYEFGKLKRTIPRKFTDEQAVGFAEEFTRTNKAYGRYAVATPDDEEPAATFAGAAKQ